MLPNHLRFKFNVIRSFEMNISSIQSNPNFQGDGESEKQPLTAKLVAFHLVLSQFKLM